ncbi:MAG: acyl-ACP--UDP-N-acetylglucosamine O-acyltransferase [Pseudomonadota bacterium]
MTIHAMAIVADGAQLHPSVEVGPFTIIDDGAVIGEGSVIGSGVRIHGRTRIGAHNQIFDNAVLGALPQDTGFDPATESYLTIGDHNVLREGVNISRAKMAGASTRLGDHNFFMCNVHLGHDCEFENHIIIAPGTVVGGHVDVADGAFISGLVAVHQFCRIGELAMIAGGTKVVKDIPPFAMADGNPATVIGNNVVGLRRNGFDAKQRAAIKSSYKTLFKSGINTSLALEQLKGEEFGAEVLSIIDFFEQSQRGVTAHR